MKMTESIPKVQKTLWEKGRNCSLRAIPPFPSVFKRLLLQTKGLVWERLKTLYNIMTCLFSEQFLQVENF